MRRPWHNPPTSHMRTGTLRFCATCILGIIRARWSITRRTAGSFRTTPKSSSGLPTFATAQKNWRSHDEDQHALDFAWGPCLSAQGCTRAASCTAKDGSSEKANRKATGKERRDQEGRGEKGGREETNRRGPAKGRRSAAK